MDAFIELLHKKDINSISVSDICKKGHLSRPTFYSHYEDINALVYKIEEDKTNKRFYKAYFTTESNTSLVSEMMQSYKESLTSGNGYSVAVHYHMLFFKAGIKEVAAEWLNRDCMESSAFFTSPYCPRHTDTIHPPHPADRKYRILHACMTSSRSFLYPLGPSR